MSDEDFKSQAIAPGSAVPKDFIVHLINENYSKTKKKRRTQGPGTPADDMRAADDARSCWFPYDELEKLFNANGFTAAEKLKFGVRIYFGMHDKDHEFHRSATGVPLPNVKYDGQHTAILVVTKKNAQGLNKDLLQDGVHSLSYGGQGMDIGSLCPPDCTGGETW